MSRLQRYHHIIESSQSSKSHLFFIQPSGIKYATFAAGLYKSTNFAFNQSLILAALTNSLNVNKFQFHGKRQKRTNSLVALVCGHSVWWAMDKLVHELLPKVVDFKMFKLYRQSSSSVYSLRLRAKIRPLIEFEDLVVDDMLDSHRGVYLPLTTHLHMLNSNTYKNEHYLRMLRVPFHFYKKYASYSSR